MYDLEDFCKRLSSPVVFFLLAIAQFVAALVCLWLERYALTAANLFGAIVACIGGVLFVWIRWKIHTKGGK